MLEKPAILYIYSLDATVLNRKPSMRYSYEYLDFDCHRYWAHSPSFHFFGVLTPSSDTPNPPHSSAPNTYTLQRDSGYTRLSSVNSIHIMITLKTPNNNHALFRRPSPLEGLSGDSNSKKPNRSLISTLPIAFWRL